MHVLITADTVGGVWTYTQELVTGLLSRGHRVTLVSFGRLPSPDQVSWTTSEEGLDYRPTEYRLEWMEVAERDVEESKSFLRMVIREVQPDLLHFSQYCYGDLPVDLPKLVVAHSDVVSWWASVHGSVPEDSAWMRWYRRTVQRGLAGADAVVAPSAWMLDAVRRYYHRPQYGLVIHNGRNPGQFPAFSDKNEIGVTAGRVWDEGKNVSLLLKTQLPFPVFIAGPQAQPERLPTIQGESSPGVEFCGSLTERELQDLLSKARFYIATSAYEPFGLAPLEAALSRCALVMNDIPVFRELWGDCAVFFKTNDSEDLARVLRELRDEPELIQMVADRCYEVARKRFSAKLMLDAYEKLYQSVTSKEKVA